MILGSNRGSQKIHKDVFIKLEDIWNIDQIDRGEQS